MAVKPVRGTVWVKFFAKVAWPPTPDGCWEWAAGKANGYGRFLRAPGTVVNAHRFIYEVVYGKIGRGLVIDHICRNHGCVNPSHMEAVTITENTLRGDNPPARNAVATHCIHGHALVPANVYFWHGGRLCRTCRSIARRRRYETVRALLAQQPRARRRFDMDPTGLTQVCAWCRENFQAKGRRAYCTETCYLAAQRVIRGQRREQRKDAS